MVDDADDTARLTAPTDTFGEDPKLVPDSVKVFAVKFTVALSITPSDWASAKCEIVNAKLKIARVGARPRERRAAQRTLVFIEKIHLR